MIPRWTRPRPTRTDTAAVLRSAPQQVVAPAAPDGTRTGTQTGTLPKTTPGQPSVQNNQLPPGLVLARCQSGQLLLISQQALAQMQAQTQGGLVPRTPTPTNVPPGQTSVGTAVAGMTPRTVGQTAETTVTSATLSKETMQNVKKCTNFLSTLIKLASTWKQSTETAASVRQLVKDLLESKLEAEEFTSKLYKELNSSPQPYLVPFLKRSLPALRQLTPDSAAFIQQSQLPQPTSGPVASTSPTPTTVVLGGPHPYLAAPISRPQLQPGTRKPAQTPSLVLQPQQHRAMLGPQLTLAMNPMVTIRNQAPGRIMLGKPHLQPLPVRPEVTPASKHVSGAALTPAKKNTLKEADGAFKDDNDINDVASMAGVNLTEESVNILANVSGLVGAVTHSCKDEAFLSCAVLQRRMLEIGRRFGVTEFSAEVVNYVSLSTQLRLQNLLEKVSLVAQQKKGSFKEDDNYEHKSDVCAQLKFFEQLDQMEKQRNEEQEREILLRAAKSRARQEDPQQLHLKQKAKEMQQQELAQMRQRDANLTALAAIGHRRKRKIQDSPSSSAAAEGSGTGPSLSGGAGSSGSRPTRQRITRVNLRDLLFCLENERFTSRSHFLYKGFLKYA